jgi:hypothetical protein
MICSKIKTDLQYIFLSLRFVLLMSEEYSIAQYPKIESFGSKR